MIFYKHIKGLHENGSVYSYITFADGLSNNVADSDNGPTDTMLPTQCMPYYMMGDYNYGYFLTSDMPTPTIKNNWNFAKNIKIGTTTLATENNVFSIDQATAIAGALSVSQALTVGLTTTLNGALTVGGSSNYQITTLNGMLNVTTGGASISGTTTISGNTEITTGCHLVVRDYIQTDNYCKALFFNATSDKRAKTNILPLELNALQLINSTPLYTFHYKNNDSPSIGILAQDVQNVQMADFKLVENEAATGENGDYMSIKESKLIYVLWKAVQEQQKEIEELKLQLKEKDL